jgi:hypothetical protein
VYKTAQQRVICGEPNLGSALKGERLDYIIFFSERGNRDTRTFKANTSILVHISLNDHLLNVILYTREQNYNVKSALDNIICFFSAESKLKP